MENKLNNDKTESEYLLEIFNLIDSLDYINFNLFVKLIAKHGLWKYYRMNRVVINKYIDNHNMLFLSLFYRT